MFSSCSSTLRHPSPCPARSQASSPRTLPATLYQAVLIQTQAQLGIGTLLCVTCGIFVLLVTSLFSIAPSPPPRTHSRGGKQPPVTSHSSVISDPSHTPPPAGHQHSPGQLLGEGQPLRFLLIFPSSPPTPPRAVQGAPLALAERLKVGVGLIEKHELLQEAQEGMPTQKLQASPATFCAHGWQLFFFLLIIQHPSSLFGIPSFRIPFP